MNLFPDRNVCERHQHLVGSVTGSTEVVDRVRKAEGENKGKTRRGSRDVVGREAVEVNESFSRERRNKAEVGYLSNSTCQEVKRSKIPPSRSQ